MLVNPTHYWQTQLGIEQFKYIFIHGEIWIRNLHLNNITKGNTMLINAL